MGGGDLLLESKCGLAGKKLICVKVRKLCKLPADTKLQRHVRFFSALSYMLVFKAVHLTNRTPMKEAPSEAHYLSKIGNTTV